MKKTDWVKSSRCANNGCVETRGTGARIEVRDSKLGDGSRILSYTKDEFAAWLDGAKAGEFDFLLNN